MPSYDRLINQVFSDIGGDGKIGIATEGSFFGVRRKPIFKDGKVFVRMWGRVVKIKRKGHMLYHLSEMKRESPYKKKINA